MQVQDWAPSFVTRSGVRNRYNTETLGYKANVTQQRDRYIRQGECITAMTFSYPEGGPTADLLVSATGKTLGEAFSQIALGMFNMMTPLNGVAEKVEFIAESEGKDLESLLFNLMDELLFINDTEFLVPKKIQVTLDLDNFKAVAVCRGERFSATTHEVGIQIKAVTYHMMEIHQTPEGWYVRMVFDT